jgi:hypothetical protein
MANKPTFIGTSAGNTNNWQSTIKNKGYNDILKGVGVDPNRVTVDMFNYLAGDAFPALREGMNYSANVLEPARQTGINRVLAGLTPGNQQAVTAKQQAQIGDNTSSAIRQLMANQNLNPAVRQALAGVMQAKGMQQQNQAYFGENDRMNQAAQEVAKLASQGQISPLFQQMFPLFQLLEQARQGHINRQESGKGGLGGIFGSALGSIPFGNLWSNAFGNLFGNNNGQQQANANPNDRFTM